jgi:ATP-dependent RNA helicase HrpB
MNNLPVTQVLPEIKKALSNHNQVILKAPTGAGKTTIVPISLLKEKFLENKTIIMLEPRRLAAISAAERMSFLLGEKTGESVGYQIKQDSCFSAKTKILVVTEGILTRKLQGDPALTNIGLIIFDEFHERNLQGDLSLAFALQSQELLRDDLKILIMSATLDTKSISTKLNEAVVLTSKGKLFPVEQIYLDAKRPQPDKKFINSELLRITLQAINKDPGNVLVFLPGVREIRRLQNSLTEHFKQINENKIIVTPLYGALNKGAQKLAISPTPKEIRKIVLATNIAETSLTIEGITMVIDSGLEKVSLFNPGTGMNRLDTLFISQNSADQRLGRAGRLCPGKCYRLWHKTKNLIKNLKPEIERADLAQMKLELSQWGVTNPDDLNWIDPPPQGALSQAAELLENISAISRNGTITNHGKKLLLVGLHPRLAHMLLTADKIGHGYEASLLAALLTERDFVKNSSYSSDLLFRLKVLHHNNFNHASINEIQAKFVKKQALFYFKKIVPSGRGFPKTHNLNTEISGILLAFAYPDRIGKQRNKDDRRYLLSSGKGAILHEKDSQINEEFLAIATIQDNSKEANIVTSAKLTLDLIETFFIDLITEENSISWNKKTQRVESKIKTKLLNLTIDEKHQHNLPHELIAIKLIEGIREVGIDSLPWNKESLSLKNRVCFLKSQNENHQKLITALSLPDFSDQSLLNDMETWLLPFIEGINSIKGCQSLDLKKILLAQLQWNQQKKIEELAPQKYEVPSGSLIAIDYSNPKSPILAVRLQELFGQIDTPTILGGEYPLLIHLLSPARRPMQVTHDLKSFWMKAYHEIKKELRGKYKRHYWPDNPLTAKATNKTKKHMK